MEFLEMDNEGGEKAEFDVHSSPSLYEHTDEQLSAIQEEDYNLFKEENNLLVASPIYGGFEEVFSSPLYDKYEDDYLEDEGPMWDVSSCSSYIEHLYQEECNSLDVIENTPCEMHEGKQVLGYGIRSEVTDVSCTGGHDFPLHG